MARPACPCLHTVEGRRGDLGAAAVGTVSSGSPPTASLATTEKVFYISLNSLCFLGGGRVANFRLRFEPML